VEIGLWVELVSALGPFVDLIRRAVEETEKIDLRDRLVSVVLVLP
jgi:hypothetical protein